VIEDADGSLLVVDTGGWYKLCCPTSQLVKPDVLGGIYRIRKQDAHKIDDPRGRKLAWATMSAKELASGGIVDPAFPQFVARTGAAITVLGAEDHAHLGARELA